MALVFAVLSVLGSACSAQPSTEAAVPVGPDQTTGDQATGDPADAEGASDLVGGDTPQFECEPFPTYSEGFAYLEDIETRSDLADGVDGAPLAVELTLVDAVSCAPLANQVVDIWGADPSGTYSGAINEAAEVDDGQRWLRGRRSTDAAGTVGFATIFPGWVSGSPPHLTITTALSDFESFTARLALDDAVAEAVYGKAPYADRGRHPTRTGEAADPQAIVVPEVTDAGYRIRLMVAVDPHDTRQRPVSAHVSRPIEPTDRGPTVAVPFTGLPDELRAMFVVAAESLGLEAEVLYEAFDGVAPGDEMDIAAIATGLGVTPEDLVAALPLLAAGPPTE